MLFDFFFYRLFIFTFYFPPFLVLPTSPPLGGVRINRVPTAVQSLTTCTYTNTRVYTYETSTHVTFSDRFAFIALYSEYVLYLFTRKHPYGSATRR